MPTSGTPFGRQNSKNPNEFVPEPNRLIEIPVQQCGACPKPNGFGRFSERAGAFSQLQHPRIFPVPTGSPCLFLEIEGFGLDIDQPADIGLAAVALAFAGISCFTNGAMVHSQGSVVGRRRQTKGFIRYKTGFPPVPWPWNGHLRRGHHPWPREYLPGD